MLAPPRVNRGALGGAAREPCARASPPRHLPRDTRDDLAGAGGDGSTRLRRRLVVRPLRTLLAVDRLEMADLAHRHPPSLRARCVDIRRANPPAVCEVDVRNTERTAWGGTVACRRTRAAPFVCGGRRMAARARRRSRRRGGKSPPRSEEKGGRDLSCPPPLGGHGSSPFQAPCRRWIFSLVKPSNVISST